MKQKQSNTTKKRIICLNVVKYKSGKLSFFPYKLKL